MKENDSLKERIKELECLYDISTLVSQSTNLDSSLPKISKRLEKAFKFSKSATAKIVIQDKLFGNQTRKISESEIKQNIFFQDELIGFISVSYPYDKLGSYSFLLEEKKLLNKVAQEIAFLYEREQRNKNEEILNEIVRRQERLTILGEMTAGVAHELNTPLGNVIGFSEFIIDSSKEANTIKDAKKIKQSALHAREIVKKLMLFSCEIPQKLNSVCIKEIIFEAIDLLSPLLKQNHIKINFEDNSKNTKATIDKIQFTQVLFNLLNNSIQASKPKSQINVKLNKQNKYITITIEDFGVGIPIEIQSKIFDPFFTHNKKGFGNGLGLSVVHGIIKQHKGRIQFSSEINVGTTFVISIPQQL